MVHKHLIEYTAHLHHDIPSGLVVFLVALPLCLGIALASGAPLFSGLIAGVVGGVVVSWASGSQLSVTGPAAGLTVIVLGAIQRLGSFEAFLLSTALAGLIQLALGFLRAGVIGAYFPSSVVKGMLAAIGLILIMKQVPHAVGYDVDFEGDESFLQSDGHTTFSAITRSLGELSPGAVLISVTGILIMLLWETRLVRKNRFLSVIPGPLLAVALGTGLRSWFEASVPAMRVTREHLVSLPPINGPMEFVQHLAFPDFGQWRNPAIYTVAVTLAVVASLESLLSLEAIDRLDPLKRVAPTNRELKAQGLGNLLSGLLGGLPVTAVIVRGSANVSAGAKTKTSCFIHGLLLTVSVMFLARLLNLIPLASLAAVLLLTGYKLAKPALFREQYRKGVNQLAPFLLTIMAVLLTDLLKGIAVGLLVGLFFVLRTNFSAAIALTRDGDNYLLRLQKDVSFLNKALLRRCLERIEKNSSLLIDGSRAQFIDQDILETLQDYVQAAAAAKITIELKNVRGLSTADALPER